MASSIFAAARVVALGLAATSVFAQVPDAVTAGSGSDAPVAVRARLDASGSPQPLCATAEGRAIWAAVQAFYATRGDQPVWTSATALTPAGQRLVAALREAADEGLDTRRYEPALLAGAPDMASIEIGLTAALARHASDLANGEFDARRVSVLWRLRPRSFDVLPVLLQAAERGPDAALETVRPLHPQYEALRAAFRHYASLAATEAEVPVLPAGVTLRPGARGPQVRALRARLAFWGDLDAAAAAGDVFDAATMAALTRFQRRHGLAVRAGVGPETVAALDTPVRERLRQIALNLERWRWQPRPEGARSVLVNIPAFELHAYDAGREALAMRVITGRPETQTPVFGEAMTSVVFSPYWNVPTNIALDETMPAVRRDRGYLRRQNLEVLRGDQVVDPARVDFRRDVRNIAFRQRPGAGNSLGLVKFQLPNPFNVYLHDTPNDALFARPQRAFSHGCVRLEKPEALARWVLADAPGWTPQRIAAAMRAGRESLVALPASIPVSIGYFTVWVDGDGTVRFLPDVYRHDAAQAPLLDGVAAPAAVPART
ncbi:MAG TPA: L,D-transpeptidase family protein, partial [Vicinamibacteria bacterium]|nr:L,D-transpeptidase family protein [Vicinamibacteria bacterium]